ncbi:conserved membrane hypothetical protein [Candidatus Roizmanbacteria bacterium]|nr:conserved membrane hypothetical protein [Candidatus Roizmanbacteria bacterium]
MKKIIIFITLLVLTFTIGKNLLPFGDRMFDFHDESQAARIQQFVLNLKSLQIPPRIAPNMSFNLGYPVFNHYAPFSYLVTSFINLIGFDIADSLKLSFLLAIILSFLFCFLFLREFFNFKPSLLAAVLYTTSPWMAVEIFIRGNLGEVWFMTLLPLVFWLIYKNSFSKKPIIFLLTSLVVSFGLTVHNALSVILIPLIIVFIFLLPNVKKNLLSLFFGFLLSAYFLIPGVLELSSTIASTRVDSLGYPDQLLCAWQLWTTPFWGYGGSSPGCIDGMSFMLGKPQILTGLIGFIGLFIYLIKNKSKKSIIKKRLIIYMFIVTAGTIFMTTYYSFHISKILAPYIGWIQFPWRLLPILLFGLSFIAAGVIIPKKFTKLSFLLIILAIIVPFYNSKFFLKDTINKSKYNNNFLSKSYIEKAVAYKVSEYLPITANYAEWLKYEPKKDSSELVDKTLIDGKFIHSLDKGRLMIIKSGNFEKIAETNSKKILINVHYLPYWKIYINNSLYNPTLFDKLGRPIIKLDKPSTITVKYEQTNVEKVGNAISIIALLGLITIVTLLHGFTCLPAGRLLKNNN